MEERLIAFVETAIREFLDKHPNSADTLEGIHRWWIRWPGPAELPVITQIALKHLESAGEVESFKIGNNILWRRSRALSPMV